MCKISCSVVSSDDVQDLVHIKQNSITSFTNLSLTIIITCSIWNGSVVVILVTPQEMFDLAECFLDRVEIRGIRRQVFNTDTEAICKFENFDSVVNRSIVEDEDTKWSRVGTTFW
jgi:hypothetical protein